MKKNNLLTIAVVLGLGSLVNSGIVRADVKACPVGIEKQSAMPTDQATKLEQIKLTDTQLKVTDSDINTWMPNKAVQAWVLRNLIWDGILPADSSVNDITKDLLASDESGNTWEIFVDSYLGYDIAPNLTEGLQYVNDKIKINLQISDTNEDRLLKLDWKQLHTNVDSWTVTVVSPEKIQNSKLLQKIKDAKLPGKSGRYEIIYQQGENTTAAPYFTPKFFKAINLKGQDFFPDINVSYADLWEAAQDKDLLGISLDSVVVRKATNKPVSYGLYRFDQSTDEGYLGTPEDNVSNRILMKNIQSNPDAFYLVLVNGGIYDDGHQDIIVTGFTYANFINN